MKQYQGYNFSVEIPDDWVDRTSYAMEGPAMGGAAVEGPAVEGPRPILNITYDPGSQASSSAEYASQRVGVLAAQLPDWTLVRQTRIGEQEGADAVLAEFAAPPHEGLRVYRRVYFRVIAGKSLLLSTQLTKRMRRFLGRAVDQVVLSMRAPDSADTEGEEAEANEEVTPGASSAGGPAGGQGASTWMAGSYRNEFFALDLPPGWEDQSVYLLFEAGKGPVLQNLVVRWDPWESGGFALEERVGDEVEIMRSTIPGFELLAQGKSQLADGRSAQQVIFRRSTGGESLVRQVQTYVPAHDRLYLLTLTGEDEPGEAVEETFASIVRSFALHGGQAVG